MTKWVQKEGIFAFSSTYSITLVPRWKPISVCDKLTVEFYNYLIIS